MRRLAVLLLCGCAAGPAPKANPLDACDLANETACVAHGASIAGSPDAPSGQLVIGLADRAATLPDDEAVDYWRRIEGIVSAASEPHELVKRKAAMAYAKLAALAVDEVPQAPENLEVALAEGQITMEKVRDLAEFAVNWGDATAQAIGARAIADAYGRQADNLAALVMPEPMTVPGRASFEQKRDAIITALRDEEARLVSGLREHCQRTRVQIAACQSGSPAVSDAAKPAARPRVQLVTVALIGAEELAPSKATADSIQELRRSAQKATSEGAGTWGVFFHGFDGDRLEFVRASVIDPPPGLSGMKRQATWRAEQLFVVPRDARAVALLGLEDVIAQHEEGICGIRIGMSAREVVTRLGDANEVQPTAAAGCSQHRYGDLSVSMCFDTVRSVQRSSRTCPPAANSSRP